MDMGQLKSGLEKYRTRLEDTVKSIVRTAVHEYAYRSPDGVEVCASDTAPPAVHISFLLPHPVFVSMACIAQT